MKKIQLELDSLQVESFETTPAGSGAQGTVYGLTLSGEPELCTDFTICLRECPVPTAGLTCGTCNPTCGSTCGSTCGTTCGSTCQGTCDFTCGNTCSETCGTALCEPTCNGCPDLQCP